MTTMTTNEAISTNGCSNSRSSQSYTNALNEAAEYIKNHPHEKELPEEILEKANIFKPPYCDSPDADTMLGAMKAFTQYRKESSLFIDSAMDLASQ